MSGADLQMLNQRFSIPGHVQFKEGPGGLAVAEIANAHAEAVIALQGAHVMTWQPKGQAPVLWLSQFAKFAPGKSIRGGVPVCWPWFGPNANDPKLPAHGYARTVMWEVRETATVADGSTYLRLGLIETDATRSQWPHPSSVEVGVTVGSRLRVELTTRNLGDVPFELGEALHTYFHISDVADMSIHGLENCDYLDKVEDFVRKTQQGPIVIESEVDRVYLNTESDCVIEDRGLKRAIRIAKEGGMVCVETANAMENVVMVAPGSEHSLVAVISVEGL